MAFYLFVALTVVFVFALLPHLFPHSLVGLLGFFLNAFLGELLYSQLPQWAVGATKGGHALTLEGVLLVYVPVLVVLLLFVRRGR